MTIFSVGRDYGPNVCICRLTTDSFFEEVLQAGWLGTQLASLSTANEGGFTFNPNDVLLINFVNTQGQSITSSFFTLFGNFLSVNPLIVLNPNLNNIFAHPGGGQAMATPLNLGFNVITVVATPADSVLLPDDVLGQTVVVVNTGANDCSVYPFLGDNIDGGLVNAAFTLTAGARAAFYGMLLRGWFTIS